MKRFALLAAAVALVGACDSTPPIRVGEVEIRLNSSPIEERSIEIGETLQLTASVRDEDGTTLANRQVQWSSSVPAVASVSDEGVVMGIAAGETLVRATADGVSDEVVITVQAPPSDLVCAEGDAGLSLSVGEVHAADANSAQILCVAGGATGAEYVLVPYNASAGANVIEAEIAANGVIAAVGPPNPSLMALGGGATGLRVPPFRRDDAFHLDLRERERRELGHLVRSAGAGTGIRPSFSTAPTAGPSYATLAEGDLITLNVNADQACTNPVNATARVMSVSTRAIVLADTANPSGGFTESDYDHFAITFDTLVYPTVTQNFGEPGSDLDDNGGRSLILFTKAVNELTEPNSDSFVGGFFFSRDLFPRAETETMGACPSSNEAEMFYMLAPDPNGEVNNNERSKEFVAERTVGVLAHEFQHLINASRRLFVVQAGGNAWVEDTWLNEGLSHIAEELVFYAATSLQPQQNIGLEELRANQRTFDAFVQYQWSNFGRLVEYLEQPSTQSALGVDAADQDLATRGAIWAFLRYAADRKAGTESSLWRSMVDTGASGLTNLNAALDDQTFAWLRDWTMAVYSDDALATSAVYQQQSWNFREIYTGLINGSTGDPLFSQYPLQVHPLATGLSNQRTMLLQGGGANYLKFGVAAGTRAAVRTTSGGLSAPSRLKLTLIRTK